MVNDPTAPIALTPERIRAIGLARYGTPRFLAAMSRDTGISCRTLLRYSQRGTDKPLAVEKIEGLSQSANPSSAAAAAGRRGDADTVRPHPFDPYLL